MNRFPSFVFVTLLACGGSNQNTPPTYADDPPPEEVVADDPVRADYRDLLILCDELRDSLEERVDEAQTRRRAAGVLAAAAVIAGEAGSSRNPSDVPTDGLGGQGRCPTNDDPSYDGPCAQGTARLTVRGDDESRQGVERAQADVGRAIEQINAAISDADEFLFSHPETAEWTDEDRDAWDEVRQAVASICQTS